MMFFVSRTAARWRLFKLRTDRMLATRMASAIDREIIKALSGGVDYLTGTTATNVDTSNLTYDRLRETVDLIRSIPHK
jgi:hypothetical protein